MWARPDRSSPERGFAAQGAKVTKLQGDWQGWSKVRVKKSGVEGWLPAAALCDKPVSQAAPAKPAKAQAQEAAPAKVPAAASQPKQSQDQGGSLLSPPAAHAAEPPAQEEQAPKRKADPKKFEPL